MRILARSLRPCHVASVIGLGLLWTPLSAFAVFTEQGATWLNSANYGGRSASLADIDNDGDLDLYFQGSAGAQQLFRNNLIGTGDHTFTNVTSTMLPAGLTLSWSAAWADYDGDGKVDVFVGQTNNFPTTGTLLRNTGSGFVDASVATGLNDPNFAQNVAWADINNDHRLDLIIGMENSDGLPNTGGGNQVYLQDASHHFTPVGTAVGIQSPVDDQSYGMAIGDTDGDGDLDIYVSTCTGSGSGNIAKAFYKNTLVESGAAKTLGFTDIAAASGTQDLSQGYGAQFMDFDNDGKLDLWVVGADGNKTKIYKNMGNNQFVNVDTITGNTNGLLSNRGSDLNGGAAIDYDNDGDLDLFFHDANSTTSVRLYRNDSIPNDPNPANRWKFTEVTTAQGITNTGAGGYDGVWGDIDLDGDLDLINPNNQVLSGVPTPERVYINDASTNGNHWLYVKLHGPDWDTTGLGSSLYATLNGGTPQAVTLRREANTNAGTFNQSDLPVHFGLGASSLVDQLFIRWVDGTAQVISSITADQYLSVTYNPGDYNGDNVVDTGDYLVWKKSYGTPSSLFTMNDYLTWRSRFGTSITPGSGSTAGSQVPEPTAIVFVLLGLGCLSMGITRRLR